eukprot:CAMPEP_0115183744 /NCGR_PEP_ID=MMETSP0270-20121206/8609_1 /TAXON_ID=71861 /ORGANISM="Scrippsiella trochoidea, Strain CCMP3099" /LENGTH=466 /DNA_ID=CAMNT_0002596817 /DNA_START=86 /DNA_END=1483 /DNA_ORIENTATION=+
MESISDALRKVIETLAAVVNKVMKTLGQVLGMFEAVDGWPDFLRDRLGFKEGRDSNSTNITITSRVHQLVSGTGMFDTAPFVAVKTALDATMEETMPIVEYLSGIWVDTMFYAKVLDTLGNETHQSLQSIRRRLDELPEDDWEEASDEIASYKSKHFDRLAVLVPNWNLMQLILNKTCQLIARTFELTKPVLGGICWWRTTVVFSVIEFLNLTEGSSLSSHCASMVDDLGDFGEKCHGVTALDIVEQLVAHSISYVAGLLAVIEYLLRDPDVIRILIGLAFSISGVVEMVWGARIPQTGVGLVTSVFFFSLAIGIIVCSIGYVLEAPHCFNVDHEDEWAPLGAVHWYCSPMVQEAAPLIFALVVTLVVSCSIGTSAAASVKSHIHHLGLGAVIGMVSFSASYIAITDTSQTQEDLLDVKVAVRVMWLMGLSMAACAALTVLVMSTYARRALVTSFQGAMHMLIGRH